MFVVKSLSHFINKSFTFSLVAITIIASMGFAQDDIKTERVKFKSGSSSAVIESSIKGYEIIDYILNAQKEQYMNVSMATKNGANYFNILEPGETEVAMFNGSINENQYEGTLTKSGDYRIRVYLMRSAARRNEVAKYRLEIIITSPEENSEINDALVPGTNYNAAGEILCSMGGGQSTTSCSFGVVRQGNGSGYVTITKPDGNTRTIIFDNGRAIGYDQNETDKGKFKAEKEGDLYIIHIGQERYEIPEAVIFGG